MNGVLLDTSFLISLSDSNRAHHRVAETYHRECIAQAIPMWLFTVVIAEFQVKQAVNDLPLRNFIILPFNVDHAMACGLLIRAHGRDPNDDRVKVKDDFKLIAQCQCEGITHVISEDANTLAKYLKRLRTQGVTTTDTVLLRDGFETAWFEHGQTRLVP